MQGERPEELQGHGGAQQQQGRRRREERKDDQEKLAKKRKVMSENDDEDQDYFEPMVEIEEEVIDRNENLETYIGNLKSDNGFKVLPHGHIVMLDADQYNELKKDNEKNYVYLKMMKKNCGNQEKNHSCLS